MFGSAEPAAPTTDKPAPATTGGVVVESPVMSTRPWPGVAKPLTPNDEAVIAAANA